MLRCVSLLAGVVALVGCAFEDGAPWGQAELSLTVEMPVPADRRVGDDIRTSTDFLVEIDHFAVTIDAMTLLSTGTDAAAFDPANPPPGYSFCHNGHCHSDDGRLVDYAEITVEAADGQIALVGGVDQTVTIEPGAPAVDLPVQCDPCSLARGTLAAAEVRISRVQLRGRVRDARTGDAQRLAEPMPFDLQIDATQAFTASVPLDRRIGRGEAVAVPLRFALSLPAQTLDAIDWLQPAPSDLLESVRARAALRTESED